MRVCIRPGCNDPQPDENFYIEPTGNSRTVCRDCTKKERLSYYKREHSRGMGFGTEKSRENTQNRFIEENKDLINAFLRRK